MIICGVLKSEWIIIFKENEELLFTRPELLSENEKDEVRRLYSDLTIILPRLRGSIIGINYTNAHQFVRDIRKIIGNPIEFLADFRQWYVYKKTFVRKFGDLTIEIRNNAPMGEYLDYMDNPFRVLRGVYSKETKTFLVGRGSKELDFRKITGKEDISDYMERGYNAVFSRRGSEHYVWKVREIKKEAKVLCK